MARLKQQQNSELSKVFARMCEAGKTQEKLPTGDGWWTTEEMLPHAHRPITTLRKHITECVKAGTLESFIGSRYKDGKLKKTVWYRETKKRTQ